VPSHQLMLRAGMIQQASAGIYSWLPFGFRALRKVEQIIIEEQDRAGSGHMIMPTMQSADLWRQSGRYDDYGAEMLRLKDRHDRDMLYGPTNEEQITEIFASHVKSYKQLPLMMYQIQLKFRDEVRPRFGVMRGREFLMKDGYSFDLDEAGAHQAFYKMFASYIRTFARMGIKAVPVKADTGPIGGDLSYEFMILAETGESEVFCQPEFLDLDPLAESIDYDGDLFPLFEKWTEMYAASDEKHEKNDNAPAADELIVKRGIEVGHIFNFGTKYSEPMGALVLNSDQKQVPVHMGSYGIGVTRVVAAIIEACHDDKGIVWPEPVAPFHVHVINLGVKDEACTAAAEGFYTQLWDAGVEALIDDRNERPGVKMNTADLMGLPWQVIIGPRGLGNGVVELKNRKTSEAQEVSLDEALKSLIS